MSRIDRIRLVPYRLPLRRPWTSATTRFDFRQGWLLALSAGQVTGYGDCVPLPDPDHKAPAACRQWWRNHLPELRGADPAELLADPHWPAEAPAAVACALESALLDLLARLDGVPLRSLLDPSPRREVPVNTMVGMLDDRTADRIRAAERAGFRVAKLKLGQLPPAETLARLKALTPRLTPGTRLRLDANRAWASLREVQALLGGLEGLPVDYIEEPLRTDDPDRLRALQAASPVPIALDETLIELGGESTLDRLLPGAWVILKPMQLGGLRSSPALARAAWRRGLRAVCTSVVESAAGIWNTAQLAACLDDGRGLAAQGLATSSWLVRDIGDPPAIQTGRITLPEVPGSGFVEAPGSTA
ncbi:MAG: o-succinylbenzoate synthase [Gammaproteobacteria bacterium]|nr:MAG: o-succinylbenzoate synthase [Gammaproteobacteria bacterium]